MPRGGDILEGVRSGILGFDLPLQRRGQDQREDETGAVHGIPRGEKVEQPSTDSVYYVGGAADVGKVEVPNVTAPTAYVMVRAPGFIPAGQRPSHEDLEIARA